jgi:tRNA threonylcarbamoyl adenosine modification protein YjeE
LRPLSKKKKEMIDLIVDAGKLPRNKPSTVIDATEAELKVLRRGDLITGSGSQTLISKSEKETEKIAEFLLNKTLHPSGTSLDREAKPIVFSLTGDLGCGKTVFSRKIGHLLGVEEKITSPTFIIYNEYELDIRSSIVDHRKNINKFLHFDLYRISTDYEFREIKFLELFTPNSVSCIEWPENMGEENFEWLKKNTNLISINFEYIDENTRQIKY